MSDPSQIPPATIPRDFPDWLSPTIVKEVRQGLRSHVFAIAFMLLHLLLIFWCLGSIAGSASDSSGSNAVFWAIFFVGLAALIFRGLGAVRSEIRGNTLELLQLTRQSAWKIIFGKWSSLLLQILLFIASLLPYAVLRYFFGAIEPMNDIFLFSFALFFAVILSAFVTFISCYGIWLSIIAGLFGLSLLYFIPVTLLWVGGVSLDFETLGQLLGACAVLAGYALVYAATFLFLAAGKIASVSDNLATRKRLAALLLLLPPWIALLAEADKEIMFSTMMAALPAAIVLIDAVLTPTSPAIPAFKPFNRAGILGRLTAFLLGPSQGGGILFSLLALALFFSPLILQTGDRDLFIIALSTASTLLLPFALTRLGHRLFPRMGFLGRYFIFVLLECLLFAVAVLLRAMDAVPLLAGTASVLSYFSPLTLLFLSDSGSWTTNFGISFTIFFLVSIVLAPFVIRDFLAVNRMCRGERGELPR